MSTLISIVLQALVLLLFLRHSSYSFPLSTNSRWFVNSDGTRVKLACVNWAAHMEPMVAEGLSHQPLAAVSGRVKELGFNCVRLTWAVYLATNQSLGSMSVRDSFLRLNLSEFIPGFEENNPAMLNLSLTQAFQAVVTSLTDNKLMVILDNHVSKPGWCCDDLDGNGFFNDEYFDPYLWITGLKIMATIFKNNPYVVGMSLRNNLRGPTQNSLDWYKYMRRGVEVVHKANPNVVVILSGLSYDTDLSMLHNYNMIEWEGNNTKLAFEMHWYAFRDGQEGETWRNGNPNNVCSGAVKNIRRMSGFLLDCGYPLFVSEFGVDMRGTDDAEYRFLSCFLAWAMQYDVDWALWTLVGSYYLGQAVVGWDEDYGVLDGDWYGIRNASLLERISVMQPPLRGPGVSQVTPHMIIFHPQTGLCIVKSPSMKSLKLSDCSKSNLWSYTSMKMLKINGNHSSCLQAQGIDTLVRTTVNCDMKVGTIWVPISDSKLHLSTTLGTNTTVCLDVDSNNNTITATCKCLSGDNACDPTSQWFKVVAVGNKLNPKRNQSNVSLTCPKL